MHLPASLLVEAHLPRQPDRQHHGSQHFFRWKAVRDVRRERQPAEQQREVDHRSKQAEAGFMGNSAHAGPVAAP